MNTTMIRPTLAAAIVAAALPAVAQTAGRTIGSGPLPVDAISRFVDDALPPLLTQDNSALAKQLLSPALAPALPQTFVLQKAVNASFGRLPPSFAADCQRSVTGAKEPDQGECTLTNGSVDGAGQLVVFKFSKNLGVGNIRYFKRAPVNANITPDTLKPVTISDDAAYKQALAFLASLGLSGGEFPTPSPTLRNPFVSSLAVGGAATPSAAGVPVSFAPVVVQKLVHIPRGIPVSGLVSGNQALPAIPAPGRAAVVLDSTGVVGAMIEDWRDLRVDTTLDPRNAKTRSALLAEIAEDLGHNGSTRIAQISAHIAYSMDWRGSFGYLVPAVRLYVTPVSGDLNIDQTNLLLDKNIGSAGFVREYQLIDRPDANVPGR